MPEIKIQTQKKHIQDFEKAHVNFITYAEVLKKILERAVNIYAPLGVVQTRAKTVASFSEKIIRKDKYVEPLKEITDLCGGRIICHFSSQVEKISHFIRDNFEVDELNSIDVKSRLSTGEFGYRSVHYIVTPRQATILGVNIPRELWTLKAEIQVRTFNEHIWADIFHDRIYKAPIKIPETWKREAARLAAILENADNSFLKMSDTIDQLTTYYLPTPDLPKVKNEKEILRILIEIQNKIDDKSANTRLELAQINHLEGDWEGVIKLLQPVVDEIEKIDNKTTKARILAEFGFAFCNKNSKDSSSKEYWHGLTHIQKAIALLEAENPTQLANAWFYKGKVLQLDKTNQQSLIQEAFDKAHQMVAENPYYYMSFLIADISNRAENRFNLDLISSRLKKCIFDCSEHVEAGIEVIEALFVIVKASLLLNDLNLALNTSLKIVDVVLHDKVVFSEDQIKDNLIEAKKIISVFERNDKCIEVLGHLLLWKKYNNSFSYKWLKNIRKVPPQLKNEILIIAGAGKLDVNKADLYEPFVQETLYDFEGTVISGGTVCGIPGLVGIRSGRLAMTGNKNYTLLGYRPEIFPDSIIPDNQYDFHVTSENTDFTFYDALMYWLDILFDDTASEDVLVVGFGGGSISLLEYKIALAMDMKVALLQDSGGALTELQNDQYWNKKENLMIVPDEKYTYWALSNRNKKTILPQNVIEVLAKQIHSYYLGLSNLEKQNPEHYQAIKDWEWESLDPNLKDSNIKQAEFIEHMLNRVGLKIQKKDNPQLFVIDPLFKTYDLLAELEHARWNAERLLSGWKPGNIKDIGRKISPYIKRWELLPGNIRKYDYEAIERFPEMLMNAGYEITEQ
jgi:ppGpp synthetase/RelA/SpoT-type nucleotidyltranferase